METSQLSHRLKPSISFYVADTQRPATLLKVYRKFIEFNRIKTGYSFITYGCRLI